MIFRSTLAIGRLPVVSRVSYMFPGSRGGVARGPGAGFPGKRARSGGEDFPRSADARATARPAASGSHSHGFGRAFQRNV